MVDDKLNKEYAGITGIAEFPALAAKLAYGADSPALDRIAITQSISGTGALRIGAAFLQRFYSGDKKIFIPNPSWANHKAVFSDAGLNVQPYRYYNKDTIGLDFEGMVADLEAAPQGSAFLFHACAHNPTGVDPTPEQWKEISRIVKKQGHFAFFDMAYQGFASGNIDKDAFAVRHFVKEGHEIALCQSFAKNMVGASCPVRLFLCKLTPSPLDRAFTASVLAPSPSSAPTPLRRSASTRSSRSSSAPCTPTPPSTAPASPPRS